MNTHAELIDNKLYHKIDWKNVKVGEFQYVSIGLNDEKFYGYLLKEIKTGDAYNDAMLIIAQSKSGYSKEIIEINKKHITYIKFTTTLISEEHINLTFEEYDNLGIF